MADEPQPTAPAELAVPAWLVNLVGRLVIENEVLRQAAAKQTP